MWFLVAAAVAAEPVTPACLAGVMVGKGEDLERVPAVVELNVDLSNRCGRKIRAFRGHIDVVGEAGLTWSGSFASFRPPLDSGGEGSAEFTTTLDTSVVGLWLAAAPYKALRMTWTTDAIVFADGSVVWTPGLDDDAARNDPRSRAQRAADIVDTVLSP